jgi:hypothetical protein
LSANLVPLAGVLFWEWSVSSVIILYWFENIVIGVLNIARMISFRPEQAPFGQALKLFLIPFFCVHYFMFCAGHGVFVFGMFPDEAGYFAEDAGFSLFGSLFRAIEIFSTPLAWAAAILAISHLLSFVVNYIGGQEFRGMDIRKLMTAPYSRIVVLHLTIIFGGFAAMALGEPIWFLVILVLAKTGVDLKMHLKEHLAKAEEEPNSESEIENMVAD